MTKDKITVFSTNGDIMFDSMGEDKHVEKKNKMFKIKKNIVNPIFEKMREFNEDSFWDMFLLKASRDNFPKGFSYSDTKVFYTLKSKYNFEMKLDEEDIPGSFLKLRDFVSDKGIMSDSDKDNINNSVDTNESEIEPINTWKELGKLQMNITFTYINKLSNKYHLNNREKKNLESIIKIGISSGYFNNKNIIVENSNITDIIPLIWNEDQRTFSIDTKNTKVKKYKGTKTENVDVTTDNTTTCLDFNKKYNISNINKRWKKFLENVFKKRN